MKYMGSKNRIAKYILPIVLNGRTPDQWYVEPFVGGANMIDKVEGKRIGADKHKYLIALLTALQNGWRPKEKLTESQFRHVKENKHLYPDHYIGYVGFNSFGASFFGGYRRDSIGKRDYWQEHINNLNKQAPNLENIVFKNTEYQDLIIPPNSIIYCDPPYENTAKYSTGAFDNTAFWQWCRDKADEGHLVYISEYQAPDDFIELWEKPLTNSLNNTKAVEKLFTYL